MSALHKRNFEWILKKSSELYSKYNAEERNPEQAIPKVLEKLNCQCAEYIREATPLLTWMTSLACDINLEKYNENASKLLQEANNYFIEKLNKKGIEVKLSELEKPTATSVGDQCNCTNFKGGMLEFLKNIYEKSPEKIEKIIPIKEILALNSLTWAYHHGKVRDPFSYFNLDKLD